MKPFRILLVALALAAHAGPSSAQEQQLGRLFFTAEQRAALDARRRSRVPDQPTAAVVASPTTRLDGYVKRSGGKSTVWLNGQAIPEAAPDAPRISSSGDPRVSVPVGETRARVRLKPGETLDRGSGAVHDVIGDGEIKVRPR
jgi:hypothetical protein